MSTEGQQVTINAENGVGWRDVHAAVNAMKTDVIAEVRILSDRVDRRTGELETKVDGIALDLAAHKATAMHSGTRLEIDRIGAALEKFGDQLSAMVRTVAYGAGAGAVLFVIAQILLGTVWK